MVAIDMVATLGRWLHTTGTTEGEVRALGEENESETTFGWEKYANTREEHVIMAEYLCVFLVLLVLTLVLQFWVGHKMHITWLPEAGATILLGMVISGMIRASGHDTTSGDASYLGFNSTIFFIGFLPPIIYNAGYTLKRRLFFANLGGIVSLAIIGTLISAILVGTCLTGLGAVGASSKITLMEGMTFGSLISATDPVSTLAVFTELKVDPNLFYMVFGESVLNDAIAITLFKTFSKFVGLPLGPADMFIAFVDFLVIFIGSALIGYLLGLAAAYFFKVVDLTHHRLLLVSIFVAMVYIPFLFAEAIQLSGIVTILFTSITTKRYCEKNIPPEAKRAGAFVFELMAYMAETAVFLFLGMAVFSKSAASNYRVDTILWTMFLCLVGRLHVYPLLSQLNSYRERRATQKNRRPNLIPMNMKHMIYFSGLRGAVAYALANIFPDSEGNRGLFIATTMVIVLLTIFINGGATISLLKFFQIDTGVNFNDYVEQLKKTAKPYKFLKFERKWIYPIVVKGYTEDMDLSSTGGSVHHFGSVHGGDTDNLHNVVDGKTPVEEPDDDYDDELDEQDDESGVARNPLQQAGNKQGFEEVSVEEGGSGVEMKGKHHGHGHHGKGGPVTLTNPPAYGDSDNLF